MFVRGAARAAHHDRMMRQMGLGAFAPGWRSGCALFATQLRDRVKHAKREDFLALQRDVPLRKIATLTVTTVMSLLLRHRANVPRSELVAAVSKVLQLEARYARLARANPGSYQILEQRRSRRGGRRAAALQAFLEAFEKGVVSVEPQKKVAGSLVCELEEMGLLARANLTEECIHPRIMAEMEARTKTIVESSVDLRPLVTAPLPWESLERGGYHTQEIAAARGAVSRIRERARPLVPAGALAVLDRLQEIPWRVDSRVLGVARIIREQKVGIGAIPPAASPERPWIDAIADKFTRASLKRRAEAAEEQRLARENDVRRTLTIATSLSGRPHFQAWRYDHRGRLHPWMPSFSFYGNDLARALIAFEEPAPIASEEDRKWFRIQGANLSGEKGTLVQRERWGEVHYARAVLAAADPFGEARGMWQQAKEPWRMLAWCFACADLECTGKTRFPLLFDCPSNALQISAALLGNEWLADASLLQAEVLAPRLEMLESIRVTAEAIFKSAVSPGAWNALRELGGIPHEILKGFLLRWLMGAGALSCLGLIHNAYSPVILARTHISFTQIEYIEVERELLGALRKACETQLYVLRAMRDWACEMGGAFQRRESETMWTMLDGFPVCHSYAIGRFERVETFTGGKDRRGLLLSEDPKAEDAPKQSRAFLPNLIQSIDGAVVREFLAAGAAEGARGLFTVCDAFGGPVNAGGHLHRLVRKSMWNVLGESSVAKLWDSTRRHEPNPVPKDNDPWRRFPLTGKLSLERILRAPYVCS